MKSPVELTAGNASLKRSLRINQRMSSLKYRITSLSDVNKIFYGKQQRDQLEKFPHHRFLFVVVVVGVVTIYPG